MRHAMEREYEALEALYGAREREIRAAERVRAARAAFVALLPDGMGALGTLPRDLGCSADLIAAREAFRAAHREATAARDEAAGFVCDLETAGVRAA